jgi:hypothetical protein
LRLICPTNSNHGVRRAPEERAADAMYPPPRYNSSTQGSPAARAERAERSERSKGAERAERAVGAVGRVPPWSLRASRPRRRALARLRLLGCAGLVEPAGDRDAQQRSGADRARDGGEKLSSAHDRSQVEAHRGHGELVVRTA